MKRKLLLLMLALMVGIFVAKAQTCEHSVALINTQGNGWEGRTLDITVNGIVVLDDITLYTGSGPLYFYFIAEIGDDIDAYYTGTNWSYYDEYIVWDGSGNSIGYSGGGYSIPTDILNMVAGNCPSSPTFGISPDETKEYGGYALNNISTAYYTQTYVVRNNGGGTLTVNSVEITGGDDSDFPLTDGNTYPVDLLNGETLSFDVTFEPTTIGVKTSTLHIVSSAPPYSYVNDITLNGTAYVAPPLNLTGEATITPSIDLTWEIPLPEGEIRYDDGGGDLNSTWLGNPTSLDQLVYTKFNATIAGNLDYIAVYSRHNGQSTDTDPHWNAIMVCPDDGTGKPDLVSTYETFPSQDVPSIYGEWILLPLTTPQAMALDDVFYIVTQWPDNNVDAGGARIGIDLDNNFGRSAETEDGGANWTIFPRSMIMRAYMSTSRAPSAKINAGSPVSGSENLPVYASGNSSRAFTDYTVHRGDVSGTYNTTFTGVASLSYSDVTAAYETTYYYAISSNYSEGTSDFSNEVEVTSLPQFPQPVDQVVTNITATSADLGWTEIGTATAWDIEWGATPYTFTGTPTVSGVSNPHNLTGLDANTEYTWKVRSDCGGGDVSEWESPSTFTTSTLPITTPYTQDFELNTFGDYIQAENNTESDIFIDAAAANLSNYGVQMEGNTGLGWTGLPTSTTEAQAWGTNYLHISAMNMIVDATEETVVVLFFDLKQRYCWGPAHSWFRVVVNGSQIGDSYNPSTQNSDAFQTISVDLSAYAGTTFNLALQHSGLYNNANGEYGGDNAYVDNIIITSCPAPTALVETNITPTSADLGWTTGGASLWDIEWGDAGFAPGTGTLITGTATNPHSLTGLTANTSYDWYVRDDCGDFQSTWIGPSTFSTLTITIAPYFEDFENGGATPNSWTNTSSTGELWQFSTSRGYNNCAPYDHTTGTGYFAWVDDSETPHSTDVTLTTPFIDVSGLAIPYLSFWLYSDNEGYTNMTLKINVWDGAAWNNDYATFTGNTGNPVVWQEFFVNLSSLTITGPIQVQFVGDETSSGTGYSDDISLDDVTIGEQPTCPVPTTQVETNITITSADLGWTTGGTSLWDIEWGAAGFTQGTGTVITGTATNPHSLTGLTDNTSYDWYVRDDCGEYQSTWTGPSTFRTPCLAPTTQVETNITAISADLGWTTGGASLWDIEWGDAGFAPGTGTLITGTATNPHTLTGLTANTSYDWYVRDDCGESQSIWTGPSTFSTSCAVITAPYFENFENGGATPFCWTNESPTTTEVWLFSTTNIGYSAPYDHTTGSGYFAAVDDSESPHSTDVTLTTPFIDVSVLTFPSLSFWLYSYNYGYPNMTLKINVWDGAAWNNDFATFTGNTGDPAVWQQFIVSLSSLTITGPIQVQFVGDETSSGIGYYDDISLDDVTIGEGPTCPAPITQVETNITTTSADLGWTTGGAYLWNIEWGAIGFTQGTGTVITGTTTNPHSLTGLTANTSYDWYVQSDCGGGDVSKWTGPNSFTTAFITPFSEDFNGIYLPNCWYEATGDVPTPTEGSSAWYQSNFANNSANSKGIKMFVYDTYDWLITPDIDLGTGNTRIRFKVAATENNNSTNPVTMSAEDTVFVLVKESAGDWSLASPLAYYTDSNTPSNTGDDVAINLTGLTGIVNFAFYTKGTGSSSYMNIHFDDFVVEEIPIPAFSISPDEKNYGKFPINNLSSGYYTQTFTVSNSGGGTLTITGTDLSDGDVSQFTLNDANNYPVDLAYTESLTFDVTFNATSIGAKTTTLIVDDDITKFSNNVPLNGNAYVAPPLNLTGEATSTPLIDLNWEIPLPEGEIKYDDGSSENWYWKGSPTTVDQFFYTKFNAAIAGNLNYIAVYTRNNVAGNDWEAIMVCPDDGTGKPDLVNTYETFPSQDANSTTGEWIILPLTTPQAMVLDDVFYIVTQWPDGNTDGPFVGTDTDNTGSSAYTDDGGSNWTNSTGKNWIMRAYMSPSKATFVKINAGSPVSGSDNLPIISFSGKRDKKEETLNNNLSILVPGIYASDNSSKAFTDYTVHRGDVAGTYNITYTDVASPSYSDGTVIYETTYFYAITSNYSNGTSEFSNEVEVTALAEFPQPIDQVVTNITATSADLGWIENGTATIWNVEYGTTGFTQGTGTVITGTATNPHSLTGLTANTSYDWYVQSDCGGGDVSEWEGPHTFITLCNNITSFPYTEEFTTGPPDCWDLTGITFKWIEYATAHCAQAPFYNYIVGNNALMTSLTFDISGLSSPALWFDWSHSYSTSYPDDELDVLVSDDNGVLWTSVWNKAGADLESNDGAGNITPGLFISSGAIDLSSFGTTVLIRFNGISGYGRDLFIDNVTIGEGYCPAPTVRVVTNITTTSANLGWTENGTATTWDIEWGATPYTFTGTPTVSGVSNPYNLTGLTVGTEYTWKVRSDCGGEASAWVGPSTFSTHCATVEAPFYEDFTATSTPDCWRNGGIQSWLFSTDAGFGAAAAGDHTPGGGTNYAWIYGSDVSINELVTPYIDISSLSIPAFEFYFFSNNTINLGDDNTLEVDFWDGAAWHNLLTYSGDNASWQQGLYNLSGYTITGDVQFRFVVIATASYGPYADILIDDVSLFEFPCLIPTVQIVTNITTTSSDLGWTENGTSTTWNIEYGTTGFTQGTGTVITGTTTNPHSLTGLTANTSYDWYIQSDCGGGDVSTWTGPHTFTTLITNDNCSGAISLPIGYTMNWTEGTNVEATDSNNNSDPIPTPGCANYLGGDVWYSVIVPESGYLVITSQAVTGSSLTDGGMAYYTNTCDALILGVCNDDGGYGLMPEIVINDIAMANETVYIRFWELGNNVSGVFDITAYTSSTATTWTGTTDTDWHTASNWDVGVPGAITNVTIPAGLTNYPTLTADAVCNNLALSDGATLVCAANLTINGTLTMQ